MGGTNFNFIIKHGTTAIWQAVLHNQMEVVQYLIIECKQDVKQKLPVRFSCDCYILLRITVFVIQGGMTFVWAAAQNGHLGLVKYFAEVHKIDPTIRDVVSLQFKILILNHNCFLFSSVVLMHFGKQQRWDTWKL